MSKDFDGRDVLTCGVVIAEPKLHFLAADAAGTLQMMEFYGARQWRGARGCDVRAGASGLGLCGVCAELWC